MICSNCGDDFDEVDSTAVTSRMYCSDTCEDEAALEDVLEEDDEDDEEDVDDVEGLEDDDEEDGDDQDDDE